MSSRNWRMRVQDILNAIFSIQRCTTGKSLQEIQENETLTKAILYDFLVIGEAARKIPVEIQARYPEIPWRIMGDMRNVVAHEYFQVEMTTIWITIQQDLPLLIPHLQNLVNSSLEN